MIRNHVDQEFLPKNLWGRKIFNLREYWKRCKTYIVVSKVGKQTQSSKSGTRGFSLKSFLKNCYRLLKQNIKRI